MGTQPTNAGIDFQQRVSAWALINMLAEIDLSNTMDIGDEIYIKKVAFESEDIIDDLVIHTKKNESIYLQMKRTASLTIQNEKSDFYKAINQFVQTYVLNSTENASYVLVTSSKSSTPIKDELRKILNSVRYNPLTFINNPLTKNEKSSFEKFKTMVEQIYYKLSNKNMGDNDFLNFISKVYIVVIDIEDGMSFEKVVLLTLENKFKVSNPKLFWSFAIKNALSFASQRLSVKKDELQHKWATHLNTYSNEDSKDKDDSFFEFEIQDSLAVGKDVILAELCEGVEWENEDLDLKNALFLIEFFRFDDNGNKKDLYKLPDLYFVSDDLKFKIIYRAATNKGMERYLLSNPHFKNKELVIMPANEIEQVEKDDHVIMYREKCLTILNANSTLTCLHCGKGISNNNCSMIEIDYIPSKLKLGIIHNECRQPLDRVLGMVSSKLFDEFSFLNNFDFDRWIKVLPNSQILSQSTDTMNDGKIKIVNWQPCNIPNSFSNFCVKMNLKNGDFHYTKVRGINVNMVRYIFAHLSMYNHDHNGYHYSNYCIITT
ncbi:hypothetical protein ACFSY7_06710 [Kurthia populi]|uniref:Restriction endonuclease type IV Mrr domain-containing protein n=1 Tax=Kurthia populi TaxID=1562132 RepID=A0ABW5XYR1_9BACL